MKNAANGLMAMKCNCGHKSGLQCDLLPDGKELRRHSDGTMDEKFGTAT